ncbi:PLP-dependent cysteine synthase family protein [Spartinivicinus ruber]|uniref:PLP-dependent cysteine synthase family protein n=1 Tax=Spartinivicinus ruber TaxID=2683272 RepID=UPI0013D67925|nr:PLP-dependent cysteine synthase family protein [Spartinivicinus ruber]
MIYDSILAAIGKTPVIKLSRLTHALKLGCNIFIKLESLNPGGSHKARIALNMVHEAENKGVLKRGSGQTIIEPSGGNTGIGLAMAAAIYGYKLVLVIPDNYSKEKQRLLKMYGAEIVLSDSRLGNNSHGEKAMELVLENPEWVMLNQQRNPANPDMHRKTTVREILSDFSEQELACFIAGIGTGGHITGIGEILRESYPNIKIIGVEPEECSLLENKFNAHDIQGLSVGVIPDVLNTCIIDQMYPVAKSQAVDMVQKILKYEGISVGISTGANLVATVGMAKELVSGSNLLTIAYDSIESYLSYFDDSAVRENEFALQ